MALERPVLALVSAYDEARFRAGSSMSGRDLGQRFQNLGFRELWRDEGAALFLWPPEEAERLRALGEEESR